MSKVALNIFNLRKGDILLTSMTDDMSLSIQKMIGSKYTHACLYLGDASFIEATLDGVNYFSPLYFVFDNIDDIKILRLNYSQYKNIDEILNKIDLAARDFSFRKYAQLTALKAGRMKEAEILGKSNIDQVAILSGWEKTVHCSQLVSLAYNIGGKIQLSNTKKPENITPPDLIASTFLIDVTNEVTFQIDEVTELEAKSYPYSPENSILTKQMIVTQQALKGMSQTFQEIGIPLPPDIGLVTNLLLSLEDSIASKIDKALNKILNDVGYYNLWAIYEKDYADNENESIDKLSKRIESGDLNINNYLDYLAFIEFEIETTYNTINKQKWNLIASTSNYHQTGYLTHKALCDMYLGFLKFLTTIYKNKLEAFEYIQTHFEE